MAEKQADKKMGFEKALARLEEIVAEMESGSLSLDKMMASFEEGTRLVKFCSAKLNEVEKKVEILTKKGDADTAEPFETEEGGDGGEKPV
jgi:exodeoxyribonuclease VII small subunit